MRRIALALALSALAVTAKAEEPRLAPAAGATLTYLSTQTTKTHDKNYSAGEIFSYVIASSRGEIAEGTIKPIALQVVCHGNDLPIDCARANTIPNAHEDNGVVTIPIPDDIGDKLAALSALKFESFLIETRRFPRPKYKDGSLIADDPRLLTEALRCDFSKLGDFLPIGKSAQTTLDCQIDHESAGWSDQGFKPMASSEPIVIDVSYQGKEKVTSSSGEWDVQDLSLTYKSSRDGHTITQETIQFSDKLGAAVKTRRTYESRGGEAVTTIETELTKVSP
jgi:hypothetical protein